MPRRPKETTAATQEYGFIDYLYTTPLSGNESLFPALYGLDLRRKLLEMALFDETAGSMLWCMKSTLAQVDWTHVSQTDGRDDDKDPEAIRMAEWADTTLIDMEHSMAEHVEEALSMAIFGFAPCEIVLKQRDGIDSRFSDKFYGIKKVPLRDQLSLTDWIYEGQELKGFRQSTGMGSGAIPIWKTLHYKVPGRIDRPEGQSLFQNALKVWQLKQKIQDSEAIGIERDLVGLPTFKIPQAEIDECNEVDGNKQPTPGAIKARARVQNAIKAVSDMRFNRSAGLIMPSDTFFEDTSDGQSTGDRTPKWDFKLVTTPGQRSIDTRTAARDYDRAIARSLMMQFLHLGDRSTGSYAMSDDQSSMAVRSLMALAMKIATEWNRKMIPLLWKVNGFDRKYMPRLRASEISKDGIVQVAQLLGGIGRSVDLWDADVDARMDLGKRAGVRLDRPSQAKAAEASLKAKEEPKQPDLFGARRTAQDPNDENP